MKSLNGTFYFLFNHLNNTPERFDRHRFLGFVWNIRPIIPPLILIYVTTKPTYVNYYKDAIHRQKPDNNSSRPLSTINMLFSVPFRIILINTITLMQLFTVPNPNKFTNLFNELVYCLVHATFKRPRVHLIFMLLLVLALTQAHKRSRYQSFTAFVLHEALFQFLVFATKRSIV